jgi:hypothetical protein
VSVEIFFFCEIFLNFFFVIDLEVGSSATSKFDLGWGNPCTLSLRGSVKIEIKN